MKLKIRQQEVLALVIVIFQILHVQALCDYERPSDRDCHCQTALTSSNECVNSCPDGNAAQNYQPQQKFKKCVTCKNSGQVVSFDRTKCVQTCDFSLNQILDIQTNTCIAQNRCDGYTYVKQSLKYCTKECPSGFYVTLISIPDTLVKGVCTSDRCPDDFYSQKGEFVCRKKCLANQIVDVKSNQCLSQYRDCNGYVSIRSDACINSCGEFEFPILKEGYFQCTVCLKNIYSEEKKPPQCLEQCPPQKPMIFYQGQNKVCQTQEFCQNYVISADGLSCSSICRGSDFIEQINDSSNNLKCVKKCSVQKSIIREDRTGKFCEGIKCTKFLSSDGKKCISDCSDILEVSVKGECQQCQQLNEYVRYNGESQSLECSENLRTKAGVELRLKSLKDYLFNLDSIYRQEQKQYVQIQLETILTDLEFHSILSDHLQLMYNLLVRINQISIYKFQIKPLILDTENIRVVSQMTLEGLYDTQYASEFQYTNLQSEKPILTVPSEQPGLVPSFNSKTLVILVSQNNYQCLESTKPDQCFQDIPLIQVISEERRKPQNNQEDSPEISVFFSIKKNAKAKQYVCLTTKNGVQERTKTEYVQKPLGIKCTFTNNVSLYLDEDCLFCSCPPDFPYILGNSCVSECPSILSPLTKQCINKAEQCPTKMISSDGKQCIFKCDGNEFTVMDDQGNIAYKICNSCPSSKPYKFKSSENSEYICLEECFEGQIIDQESLRCLSSPQECDKILINNKYCHNTCPKEYFLYPKENEQKYQTCNQNCDKFQIINQNQKFCESNCHKGQITDDQAKKCYNTKQECPNIISSNGKECNNECDTNNREIVVNLNSFKQCQLCKDYLKIVDNVTVTCVPQCEKEEMIYVYGSKNEIKRCESKEFCSNKKLSQKNSRVCSDSCIKPFEINYKDQCVSSCPENTVYQTKLNMCTSQCEQFLSSNGKSCVESCSNIFEVIDTSNKQIKQCKKCSQNEFFVTKKDQSQNGTCQTLETNSESRQAIKENIISLLKEENSGSQEDISEAKKVINSFANQIEIKLKQISQKQNITSYDHAQAKSAFQDLLEISSALVVNIQSSQQTSAFCIGSTELKVISQVLETGKQFMTRFSSESIILGSFSTLLESNSDNKSDAIPTSQQILQISYIKNNHFCRLSDCSSFPPLFVATYTNPISQNERLLYSNHKFSITYPISGDKLIKKYVCLQYDQDGTFFTDEGIVANNNKEIICQFSHGSTLYYDEKCDYVNKNHCFKEKQQSNDTSQEMSKGMTAGIIVSVVGTFAFILILVFYFCVYKKKCKNKQKENQGEESTLPNQQQELSTQYNSSIDIQIQKSILKPRNK